MEAIELVRKLIGESHLSQNKIASLLDLSPQVMSQRMQAKDLKASFLAKVLGQLGYRLAVIPAGSNLPPGSLMIGDEKDVAGTPATKDPIDDIDIDELLDRLMEHQREKEASNG